MEKYDLIFPMGSACSCAETLITAGLRQFSCPFDWVWGSDFSGRIKIFVSDFERFLEKEDLTSCNYNNGDQKNLCDVYENHYTKLFLNHDFPSGVSLDESYPAVKEKYDRRIKRLIDYIEKASRILIVYIETPNTEEHASDTDIINGWEEIHRKHPDKRIDLLYFINDNQVSAKSGKEAFLSKNIIKIRANYKYQEKDALPYETDIEFLVQLLSFFALTLLNN